MKKYLSILIIIMISLGITGCYNAKKSEHVTLTLAAAASLTNPMEQIIENFEKANPNYEVLLSFSSSGSLQKQINEGAPIDIFISASTSKFDPLVGDKISKENSQLLLSNSMTLISYNDKENQNSKEDLNYENFTNYSYSIGDPDSVPAGRYAYEILENMGLWTENNKNQITAKSVRQVLNYVESNNVKYGIVYFSDAYNNEKVTILKTFDPSMHSHIYYPIGIIDSSMNNETKFLYDYISSDEAMDVFIEYGFKSVRKLDK